MQYLTNEMQFLTYIILTLDLRMNKSYIIPTTFLILQTLQCFTSKLCCEHVQLIVHQASKYDSLVHCDSFFSSYLSPLPPINNIPCLLRNILQRRNKSEITPNIISFQLFMALMFHYNSNGVHIAPCANNTQSQLACQKTLQHPFTCQCYRMPLFLLMFARSLQKNLHYHFYTLFVTCSLARE